MPIRRARAGVEKRTAERTGERFVAVRPFAIGPVAVRPAAVSSAAVSPATDRPSPSVVERVPSWGHNFPRAVIEHSGAQRAVGADPWADSPRRDRRLGIDNAELAEFGPLQTLVSDAAVTDVVVNGPEQLWVDRGEGLSSAASPWKSEAELRAFAVRLIALGGRHIDEASPLVDVRLHHGIRVHAVLPPLSTGGTLLSIRLPRVAPLTIDQLAETGFFAEGGRDRVIELVRQRKNILITGASGSGKTTLLAALLAVADGADRIIAIEDVAELCVQHPHFVSLETRQKNLEGAGGVGLRRLVREALRMRPDRLVLGECRGAEIRELLAALNTGHDGGAGTLHANSLADVPARLEALGALAGMSPTAVARQAVSAIGAVVHLSRSRQMRTIEQIGRFELDRRGRLQVREDD